MGRRKKTLKDYQPFGVKALLYLQQEVRGPCTDELFDMDDIARRVFDGLVEEFQPQGLLEELWMYDIAKITMNIQKFRVIERSVMLNQMLRNVEYQRDKHGYQQHHEERHRIYAEDLSLSLPHWKHETDQAALKIVAHLSEEDIRKLAAINDLISKQQRERDRIFAQFERKRRPLIQAEVTRLVEKIIPAQIQD